MVSFVVSTLLKFNPDHKVDVPICNRLTKLSVWFCASCNFGSIPRASFRKGCYSRGNSNSHVLYCPFPWNVVLGHSTFPTENCTDLITVSVCLVFFLCMDQKYFSIYFFSQFDYCATVFDVHLITLNYSKSARDSERLK